MGQALAAVQRAQQEGGRVILTAAAALDDAGREALWEAYIADKEYLVEMLGVSVFRGDHGPLIPKYPDGVQALPCLNGILASNTL